MRIKLFLLLYISVCCSPAEAQFEKDYTPVESKGKLPQDFITLSSKRYETAKNEMAKNEKGSTLKAKQKFLLESSFSIDDLLLSGKVLFNDPMADFVNKVADKVLESEPETRKQLRFYVYKSTSVNALSTNEGVVFVTTGLLAQLENEAQLAFAICHEVVHFKEKHAVKIYLEADKINRGKGDYRQLDMENKVLAHCAFSKEQEKEADEKGLLIYLKSKYSTLNVIGVYDVLKYAYLPFDDITFDKSFLENAGLKFPSDFFRAKTDPIDTKDILDEDKRSTHPSVASRRAKIEEGIKGADNAGKADYLVSESTFKNVRETARFEICRLYTLSRRYEAAIYTSYLLLKKYPDNLYLKKNVAWGLAGLAAYSAKGDFKKVHYNSDSVEGKSQQLFYMMYKLDSARSGEYPTIVALTYATRLHSEYPADENINELYHSLMYTLVKKYNVNYSDFSTTAYIPTVDSTPVAVKLPVADGDETNKSKYQKLREQRTETVKTESHDFSRYAFIEYMNKDWFKQDFANVGEEKDKKSRVEVEEGNQYARRKYWDKRVYALGLNRLVVVDPLFARINARKKEKYKYIESESGQVDFAERLKMNAAKVQLNTDVLSTKNLGESEVDKLNEISALSDYINERLDHEKGINLPYPERDRINGISKKYGTDNFMWTGAISLTDRSQWHPLLILYTILLPPVLLFTIPKMINGGQYTIYYALVYDVKTDEIKMATYREINNRTKGYILNSHIYDVFNQVKNAK